MKARIILLIFLCAAFNSYATLTLSSVKYWTSEVYNTSTGFEISQNIKIRHSGDAEDYFITISPGISGDPHNRRAEDWSGLGTSYFLYNNPAEKIALKDLSASPDESEVISGSFISGSNHTKVLRYYLAIPPGNFPPAGYFTDSFTISLYSGTLDSYTLVSSANVSFAIQVNQEIDFSLVSSGGTFDITQTSKTLDFGILSAGQQKAMDILVRSNLKYSVDFTSKNGGVLKRSDVWSNDSVPYSCTINGAPITLSAWQAVEVINGSPTSGDGTRYELLFTIEDFWDISDGPYEDTIQITVSAQ